MSALPIARLFGFEIRVHVSWALILAVVAVAVVTRLEELAPDVPTAVAWLAGGIVGLGFLLSALAHELGHAVVARRFGSPGAVVVVFFFGGAADPALEMPTPRAEALTALAGPVVSLVIGVLLLLVATVAGIASSAATDDMVGLVSQVALAIGAMNVVLGGVNLLPAFPLDGGRVARAVIWHRRGDPNGALVATARLGRWVGVAFAVVGIMLILTRDAIDGLMLALGGWFLASNGRFAERAAAVDALLRQHQVREVVAPAERSVPVGLTLDTFAEHMLGTPGDSVPVMDGSAVAGVLGASAIRGVRRARWSEIRAGDVMTALAELPSLSLDTDLRIALDALLRTGLDGLPVFESGAFAGLVTRHGVARLVRESSDTGGSSPGSASDGQPSGRGWGGTA